MGYNKLIHSLRVSEFRFVTVSRPRLTWIERTVHISFHNPVGKYDGLVMHFKCAACGFRQILTTTLEPFDSPSIALFNPAEISLLVREEMVLCCDCSIEAERQGDVSLFQVAAK